MKLNEAIEYLNENGYITEMIESIPVKNMILQLKKLFPTAKIVNNEPDKYHDIKFDIPKKEYDAKATELDALADKFNYTNIAREGARFINHRLVKTPSLTRIILRPNRVSSSYSTTERFMIHGSTKGPDIMIANAKNGTWGAQPRHEREGKRGYNGRDLYNNDKRLYGYLISDAVDCAFKVAQTCKLKYTYEQIKEFFIENWIDEVEDDFNRTIDDAEWDIHGDLINPPYGNYRYLITLAPNCKFYYDYENCVDPYTESSYLEALANFKAKSCKNLAALYKSCISFSNAGYILNVPKDVKLLAEFEIPEYILARKEQDTITYDN